MNASRGPSIGLFYVMKKDLKTIFRDRSALVFIFGIPLLFTGIFGFAFGRSASGGARSPIKVLAFSGDKGPRGAAVVKALREVGLNVEETASEALLRDRVKSGDSPSGVVIPADFSARMEQAVAATVNGAKVDPVPLRVLIDPAQTEFKGMTQGAVFAATQRVAGPLLRDASLQNVPEAFRQLAARNSDLGAKPIVTLDVAPVAPPSTQAHPSGGDQLIPGLVIYFIFFVANGMAISLISEREHGTLRRLLSAPIPRGQILLGKMLARAFVCVLQTLMVYAIGAFLLNLHVGSSLLGVVLIIAVTIFAACGLGLLIASFGKTMEQIQGMTTLSLLLMGFISGCLLPRALVPPLLQKLGRLTPHTWALDAYQNLLLRNLPLSSAFLGIGVTLLFGLAFFALALRRFSYE